ncbi:replication/maintenance protein RepL [Caldicellulosiruptor bescii]|uniref:Plasmid replication protein RepL domain-containing protein n=3 Tax=Caldicellulosiruptor bescii TaxID=31899 RepID=B9MSB3_CALBD|nr:replication/maintenance protein RepL [Caldicellulosiruptor bescii]ACM61832.1 hypothetical protein Athe_2780 [Caldicellulosiruptor bescii DSM 6725]PBC87120.1 replication protein RepL [Caldicellulosiruptor bescii]PBD02485.1 replication protein RepL [Caldicellulosiruptor bescii]PFH12783.1 replication protein RepL [Caldicellulosiruptor bescii]SKC67492.1 replication protein (RepL) [Caldicellulosiruptor bescii]
MKKIGYKKMVDPETGEVQTFILIGHDFEDTDFVKLPFISIKLIMEDKDLAKSAMRILSYIVQHKISFNNYTFALSYEYDIKGNIDMSKKQYHLAIKKLIEKDLLIKIGRGRFMLNPRRIRYGRADQLRKFESEYDKIKKTEKGKGDKEC